MYITCTIKTMSGQFSFGLFALENPELRLGGKLFSLGLQTQRVQNRCVILCKRALDALIFKIVTVDMKLWCEFLRRL